MRQTVKSKQPKLTAAKIRALKFAKNGPITSCSAIRSSTLEGLVDMGLLKSDGLRMVSLAIGRNGTRAAYSKSYALTDDGLVALKEVGE